LTAESLTKIANISGNIQQQRRARPAARRLTTSDYKPQWRASAGLAELQEDGSIGDHG
jgi:hypothetical protein